MDKKLESMTREEAEAISYCHHNHTGELLKEPLPLFEIGKGKCIYCGCEDDS